jgi:hypothetical protein
MYKKSTVHNPVKSADWELTRARQMKGSAFYELDENGKKREIKSHVPTHTMEFRGAISHYLNDFAKYMCTHHRDALDTKDEIYIKAEVTYENFLDFTIGEFKNQRPKLLDELANIGKRRCYVPEGNGTFLIMTPYIVNMRGQEHEEMTKADLARYGNISHPKITKVFVYFPTAVFGDYLSEKNRQFYRHPVNLYAKMYDFISNKLLVAIKGELDMDEEEELTSPTFVEGYIKFFDYLYKHGAGNPEKTSLLVNEVDLVETCMPSLLQHDGNGQARPRETKQYGSFFKTAIILNKHIKGFSYHIEGTVRNYPCSLGKKGWMLFNLGHSAKALEAQKNPIC